MDRALSPRRPALSMQSTRTASCPVAGWPAEGGVRQVLWKVGQHGKPQCRCAQKSHCLYSSSLNRQFGKHLNHIRCFLNWQFRLLEYRQWHFHAQLHGAPPSIQLPKEHVPRLMKLCNLKRMCMGPYTREACEPLSYCSCAELHDPYL